MYIYIYIKSIHPSICPSIYLPIYLDTHIYIYIHTYIHTYIHIHTCLSDKMSRVSCWKNNTFCSPGQSKPAEAKRWNSRRGRGAGGRAPLCHQAWLRNPEEKWGFLGSFPGQNMENMPRFFGLSKWEHHGTSEKEGFEQRSLFRKSTKSMELQRWDHCWSWGTFQA